MIRADRSEACTRTSRATASLRLVADILRVRGFVCDVSTPGPDQGVDILAGSGPLGLDSPTLIVEVKSEEGQIKASVVRGLQGAMLSNRSDQGLLVAWGGITKEAKREIRTDRLTMRVWDADDLLDQVFEVYEQLPEETRRQLPLKRAWVLDEEGRVVGTEETGGSVTRPRIPDLCDAFGVRCIVLVVSRAAGRGP
ncbi:MAG: restriction endonuclease [Nocardioidaceae bacterium]